MQITEALQQHNTDRAPAEGQHHQTTKSQSSLQHQANGMQAVCRPLVDSAKQWEEVAAAEYAADGDMQGWQQDNATPESSEDKFLKVLTGSVRL